MASFRKISFFTCLLTEVFGFDKPTMSTKKKWAWMESGRRISGTGLSEMLLPLEGDKGVGVGTIGYKENTFLA